MSEASGVRSSIAYAIYSGAAFGNDKQQAFAAGAQGYLVKPVDNDRLIEQVSRLIPAAKLTTIG